MMDYKSYDTHWDIVRFFGVELLNQAYLVFNLNYIHNWSMTHFITSDLELMVKKSFLLRIYLCKTSLFFSQMFQGHAARTSVQIWVGLRFCSTRPSMMAGSCDEIKKLQVASNPAMMDPNAVHNCCTNSTISVSVLSLVSQVSMSVMMSVHSEQVSSFLG